MNTDVDGIYALSFSLKSSICFDVSKFISEWPIFTFVLLFVTLIFMASVRKQELVRFVL